MFDHVLSLSLCAQEESQVTGSGAVSGVLIFTVLSALMGLVRAAYEEKSEYFASLTSNILRSAQRALDTIQQTHESVQASYLSLSLSPCSLPLVSPLFILSLFNFLSRITSSSSHSILSLS